MRGPNRSRSGRFGAIDVSHQALAFPGPGGTKAVMKSASPIVAGWGEAPGPCDNHKTAAGQIGPRGNARGRKS